MGFRSLFDLPDPSADQGGGVQLPPTPTKSQHGSKNGDSGGSSTPVTSLSKGKKPPKPGDSERGCNFCPLNNVEGITKIKGTVEGKDLFMWVQSPGQVENDEGRELVGPAGQWLWKELKAVGLYRSDFDIQNCQRCLPADIVKGSYNISVKMRNPAPEELHCCSLYTDRAIEKSKAKQVLIFGKIAAQAVLKTRSLPKQKIFWSDALRARVYLLDHPAFFVRGYGQGARLNGFRQILKKVVEDRVGMSKLTSEQMEDQFAYIRTQDYQLVLNREQAGAAAKIIRKNIANGHRVGVDIESDEFDGKTRVFACGFSPKPGQAFVFVFIHKDQNSKDGEAVLEVAKELIEDGSLTKVLQYGCSDRKALKDCEGILLNGFNYDSNLSEYLRFSDKKQYGLDDIAEQRFPDFSGYKTIVATDLMRAAAGQWEVENPGKPLPKAFSGDAAVQYKYLQSHREVYHLRELSLDTLRCYNGADCDLTKRIEISNKGHVKPALVKLYIDLNEVLSRMEPNGPLVDFEQLEKLEVYFPWLAKRYKHKLRKMLGQADYNPGSPQQVYAALYKKLKLVYPFEGKPNTQKIALTQLGRDHEFPRIQLDWRKAAKMDSTMQSYRRSAMAWGGRLCTRWWSTGARTGRASSGGEKNRKDSTIVNLQNIKKDANVKDILIADLRWKQFYESAGAIVDRYGDKAGPYLEKWVKENLPDLQTFLVLDYGQVEIRVMAQLSGDKNLKKDCMESDIHAKVGSTMTGWDVERIRNDEATRTLTKNCIAEGQRVFTDHGQVPIEKVTLEMRVWDGLEFVVHDGVIYQGEREVITYDGLTATPDHKVWFESRKVSLASIAPPQKPKRAKVYDILNAGYNHRFTVEGHLVSNCHFGIAFGLSRENLYAFVVAMSPPDMRDRVTREQVYEAYDNYFRRYPGIRRFHESQRAFGQEHKYVETLFGMHQALNVIQEGREEEGRLGGEEDEDERGSYWGNQAINGPVQGTAHQLLICGLVNVWRQKKRYKLIGYPVMEVHDAMYWTVPVLQLIEAYALAKQLMEQESLTTVAKDFPDIKWDVPIIVDGKAGLRLGCVVKVKETGTVGDFLLSWYRLCKQQVDGLEAELQKVN